MAVQIITATCALHNYCLLHDDLDDGYLLPGHADGGGDDDGSEQQGPPDHGAAQKRVHLMNIMLIRSRETKDKREGK